MRIRNRPAPSVFPPPPDLNLNRSFPLQVQHDDASAAALPTRPRDYHRPCTALDQPAAASAATSTTTNPLTRSANVSSKRTRPSSAAGGTDDNDTDTTSWKPGSLEDNGTGVQPSARTKDIASKGARVERGSGLGAPVTEGSRCSRVNGRGWRCSQQTLVGYSLCEHHLGKSRLRSLSSVKNSVTTSSKDNSAVVTVLSSHNRKRLVEESDSEDEEQLLISSGRRKSRIGTVKARSLSSLLGKTSPTNNGISSQPSSIHRRNLGN